MSLSNTQEVDKFWQQLTVGPYNITVVMRGAGVKTLHGKNFRTQLISTQYIHKSLLKILGQPRLDCGKLSMKWQSRTCHQTISRGFRRNNHTTIDWHIVTWINNHSDDQEGKRVDSLWNTNWWLKPFNNKTQNPLNYCYHFPQKIIIKNQVVWVNNQCADSIINNTHTSLTHTNISQ